MATIAQGSVTFLSYAALDNMARQQVVGGGAGGGGGNLTGGGGAGGEVLEATTSFVVGSYPVVVGAAGPGGTNGTDGSDSTFNGVTAKGGSHGSDAATPGGNGTNGGGGGEGASGGTGTNQPGGDGTTNAGGGGAGNSQAGQAATSGNGGNGGLGTASDITGTSETCGDGGGGAGLAAGGTGGSGTGGTGAAGVGTGGAASPANRGSGGGGGRFGLPGGPGSDGRVVIRYRTGLMVATGGTITTTVDGYTVHVFTSSGTFVVTATYDLTDRTGQRITINKSTGALLSLCPTSAFMQNTGADPQVLQLDGGKWFFMVSNVGQVYLAAGTRLVARSYNLDVPPSTINGAILYLSGSDHTTKFYHFGYYRNPTSGNPYTRYLVGGELSATSALASGTRAVDNVVSDGSGNIYELYGLGANASNVLYYIKGDHITPASAAHTLKTYDVVAGAAGADVKVYAAGVAYPVRGLVFRDGSLLMVFSDGTLKKISEVDGTVAVSYTVSGTVNVFAGLTDTSFWVQDGSSPAFRELRRVDGVTLSSPTLNSGYTLLAIAPGSIAQVAFQGCTLPPQPGDPRYIRRVRRFALPFDRSFFVYLDRIEFLIQSGVGTTSGQGIDPMIQVRFSGDGGETWSKVLAIRAGAKGERYLRPVINRIGKLRNGYCEIAVSDPVLWYFLACFVNADVQEDG